MKKKFVAIVLLIFCFVTVLGGCSKSVLDSASENLSEYSMNLFYNEAEHTVSGSVELKFVNNFSQPITDMVFCLWANGFSEGAKYGPISLANTAKTYPNGVSYGGITVSEVKVDGSEVLSTVGGQDKTALTITLPRTIYVEEKAKVTMNFISTLPNANHRFGYGDSTVNITGFFPVLAVLTSDGWANNPYSPNGDPFFTDCANYKVQISYPKTYTIASTGVQNDTTESEDIKKTIITAKVVRDFAMILSKDFQVIEKEQNGTMVKYYYIQDTDPNASLETGALSIKTYENLFGDYPYDTLSVVECNFVHGGMEFPNLVMISNTLSSREEINEVIAHEIAHQWWYGMVGSNAFEHGWLDEGLTEFSTAMFFEKNPSYGLSKAEMITNANKSYTLFVDVYSEVFGKVDTSMDHSLNDFKTEPEYVYTAYVKSLLMYDNLYELMGEKKFLKAVQNLLSLYRFQNIEPAHLIATFQKVNKTDLESFFSAWIDGKIEVVGQ